MGRFPVFGFRKKAVNISATNTVFSFRFPVKKTRIIRKLKLKFVALETELGIRAGRFINGA
jgi:hypothetical protein